MRNKLLCILTLICFIFISALSASAFISSEYEVKVKADKLQTLVNFDFMSLVNKNDLVGYRLSTFQMNTQYYINSVNTVKDNLYGIDNQINIIRNSTEISDTEKSMQTSKLLSEADSLLSDLDSKTVNYIIGIKSTMPTVTYQNYARKFTAYYNSLNISGNPMTFKNW